MTPGFHLWPQWVRTFCVCCVFYLWHDSKICVSLSFSLSRAHFLSSDWLGTWFRITHELYWGGDHVTMTGHVRKWGIETSFRLRIMDYLPNTFPSLWVLLFLTWWMHTYVEIFAYIVNIIWAPLEIILWETIHSSLSEKPRKSKWHNFNPDKSCRNIWPSRTSIL